ncbi:A.superbus venom factor 1-like isoform X2 [Lineus longissimus]|uniref:A.superbus venom factor 1-like isoform X2 n=1 Tax=Lineus longissimus TaxID=88925 RepID=UPI00315D2D65
MLNTPWLLGAFMLLAAAYQVDASPSLFVTSPNLLRVNSSEDIWVTLHGPPDLSVSVSVYLENYPDRARRFSNQTITVKSDESKKVTLRVGWGDIPLGSQQTYVYLVAKEENTRAAPRFSKESVILLSKKSGYLFLQTDKPLYNPHEKVNIRAVSLNSDMKPSNINITIDIINPNGDLIKRYPKRQATNGFISEVFYLPRILTYGNWTLLASYAERLQPNVTKTKIEFEIKEYVLPMFSVKVEVLHEYILSSQEEIQYRITAEYVFGTPVKGRGTAYIFLLYPEGIEEEIDRKSIENVAENIPLAISKDKFEKQQFPPEGTRLLIKVTVTEAATGKREQGSDSSAIFVTSPYVISYERTPRYFKPGLSFKVKVDLTFPTKAVAANVKIVIQALVTLESGQREGAHSNKAEEETYVTDINGRKEIVLDINAEAKHLTINVTTQGEVPADHQASKLITFVSHSSSLKEYMILQLGSLGSPITINNKLQMRLSFSKAGNKKVNLMVVARGKILQHFVKDITLGQNDRAPHESIQITPIMSPRARVIAYYSSGCEIISDSLLLDIVKKCGSELTITYVKKVNHFYSPGDPLPLKVTAGKGSSVSLLGVDKAVYLLSEKDILTRSKMFKKMQEMDIGCGPGGGRDSSDVFKQAGLIVMTNSCGHVVSPRRNTEQCEQNVVRRKRDVMEAVTDIMAVLRNQDKICCNRGVQDSVNSTKSCRHLASEDGSTSQSCTRAYMRCCNAIKSRVAGGRGRSSSADGDVNNQPGYDESNIDHREDFKETWFNELLHFGPNETNIDLKYALPDSVTTWVISGVSVSPEQGMCVAVPTNITSKKVFFVHVDLPYTAVRTEQLEVKATVYNLLERKEEVTVYLKASDNICYNAARGEYTQPQVINVDAKSAKSVIFPIVPLKATTLNEPAEITVKALSKRNGDIVSKKLRIDNEGMKKSKTDSYIIDPEGVMGDSGSGSSDWNVTRNKREKRHIIHFNLTFPYDTIPNTDICSVSIHGNLLGPMVPSGDFDITNRIQLPQGCGEQNIAAMGPLVYATNYLKKTGKLTGRLEDQAYDFITKGYQSQLAFKKKDGSFAAYSSSPSSAWLTAFVAKVFCQAASIRSMGEMLPKHVEEAVNWLFKNAWESESGRFFEKYHIRYPYTLGQGQTLMNDVTLSSFIVECIATCKDVINQSSGDHAHRMRTAVQYLEDNRRSQLGKPYGQAILAYALTLTHSIYRHEANQDLWNLSHFDSVTGMRYWSLVGEAPNHNEPTWYTEKPPAVAIETASYAVLAQLALGDQETFFTKSGPIASWLIRQRTKTGAFSSTTDTVLGLEALSEYAFRASSRSTLGMLLSFYGMKTEKFELTEVQAFLPRTFEIDIPSGGRLSVEANGTGIAQIQVECSYHAPFKEGEGCPFTLEVECTEYIAKAANLDSRYDDFSHTEADRSRFGRSANREASTKYVARISSTIRFNGGGGQKVGMSILDVSLFTGFTPWLDDLKKLKDDGTIDGFETTRSAVLFYLKEISSTKNTSVTFRATQEYKVGKTQPVAVKVYDYYEPNRRQCTKFYHPSGGNILLAQSCNLLNRRKVCHCLAGTCAKYWGFNRTHLDRGQYVRVKNRTILFREACNTYDYAVKVKAGKRLMRKPVVTMTAQVERSLKPDLLEESLMPSQQFFILALTSVLLLLPEEVSISGSLQLVVCGT